jgi:DNA-binding beta-propeller fold protein YncE
MKLNLSISKLNFAFVFILMVLSVNMQAQTLLDLELHRTTLPNGWKLTPVGKLLPLGDLPLNIAISPSGKIAAVTNNGESTQTIQLIDIDHEAITDSIIIRKSWLGLTFSDDGR